MTPVDGYFAFPIRMRSSRGRLLASEQGIVAGCTTSANVAAALELADALTPDELIVTIACDTGMKYLSADLFE